MGSLSRRLFLVLIDALLLYAAVMTALWLRFDGQVPVEHVADFHRFALPYVALGLLFFFLSGMYSSLWRYASVDEVFVIVRGTTLATAMLVGLLYALPQVGLRNGWSSDLLAVGFPRSVLILSWLILTGFAGALRFSYRYLRRWTHARNGSDGSNGPSGQQRVLVVGAGDAGVLVAEELSKHGGAMNCVPVGFVDDDARKLGMRIHGLRVLGTRHDLPAVINEHGVDEVIIAMPSAPGSVVREIVSSNVDAKVKFKILPGIYELLNGSVTLSQIREVQVEDLLGRAPVHINLKEVAGYLRGKRVLITGAGGSIGSELCRQVARFEPAFLALLDHSENGVFETSLDLQHRFPDLRQQVMVADVRDGDKIPRLFRHFRPAVIFHAAAHKHVPLMEESPDEAIKTNIFGTRNVARAASEAGVGRFILISTDKAVNPTSVMGATKRVAEMVIQAMDAERREQQANGTVFAAVRFGNVLGSRGSVVPIFQSQIARGGPVTLTHPDMRRYFMTIPEAAQLVIQAGAMGTGGEIFILDMGEPVRIRDLAENLIRLSGFEPGIDIPIKVTGPRPGEKLFEELLTAEEGADATRHERIFIGRIPNMDVAWLHRQLKAMEQGVQLGHDNNHLVASLHDLVPGLHSPTWGERIPSAAHGSVASVKTRVASGSDA